MSSDKQSAAKSAVGKAFVIPKPSYQVNISKSIPIVVATSSKKPDNGNVRKDSDIKKGHTMPSNSNSVKASYKKTENNKSNQGKPSNKVITKFWWETPTESPILSFEEEKPWFSQYSDFISQEIESGAVDGLKLDEKKFSAILQFVESTYASEVNVYLKVQAAAAKGSSDQKWINDVIKSGTLSDKIAALALKIQASPFHHLETLDMIVNMACKKEQRTAQLALEAVKDLLINNLLTDRKLVPFKSGLLLHPKMTLSNALLLYYEGQLKSRVEKIVEALETGLKSNVDYFKKICLDTASSLLMNKPEQESRLLSMITNKLGDPTSKTCSKCIETLKQILYVHPAMKGVIVREVRQFIYKPHNKLKAIFNGVLFLSQVTLVPGDHEVATQLVECYVSLFEKAVKEDELGSRLLSALLTGINKSFPFLENIEPIVKYADSLFRLVHTASFTSSTQALMLLSHLAITNTANSDTTSVDDQNNNKKKQVKQKISKDQTDGETEEDDESPANQKNGELDAGTDIMKRYYRALYAKLLSDQVTSRAKNTLLLNLLFKSIKKDPSEHRAMAFLKRLSICATHSSPSIAAGLLFLISEVIDARPDLKKMLSEKEEDSFNTTQDSNVTKVTNNDDDDEEVSNMLGNFDASKREPEYAASARPNIWEASLLRRHFHPSVQAFAHSLLDPAANHHINFNGDPTTDFSLMAFLNRFAYKNPKKSIAEKIQQRKTLSEEPINVSSFIQSSEGDIAPDKQFFHKFFGEREKLREEGRSRDRSKHRKKSTEDEEDSDATGSDADEAEIDEFANKLAEDLMREHDINNNPDLDDDEDLEFSEDESDSDDSKIYDNPNGSEESEIDSEGEGSGNKELYHEKDADYDSGSDSDMGFDGMNGSESDESDSDEEPVMKSKKTRASKSNAVDFADFVNEKKGKSTKKGGNKNSSKDKKFDRDSDDDSYTGLVAYNEDEDEDLKPRRNTKDNKKNITKPTQKAEPTKESNKDTSKSSKKNSKVESDDDVQDDMEAMEFDEDGNCDDSSNDVSDDDDYDEDEEFDLIVGNENNNKKNYKNKSTGKRKRTKGGNDFASADDYEAEMEAILKQIQQHSNAGNERSAKPDKKKTGVVVSKHMNNKKLRK